MSGCARGTAAPAPSFCPFRRRQVAARRARLLGALAAYAGIAGIAGATIPSPAAPVPAGPASTAPATPTCGLASAYFSARLRGAIERELHWRAADMSCEGMNRPDGRGLRVAFAGRAGRERLTFVLGMPRLAEGASGDDVPVNLTLLREGGAVYGTRGEDRCMLDVVRQDALDVPPSTAKPRRWRIEARGFCLEPARAVADGGRDAILVATFDFAGQVTWEPDPNTAPPVAPPVASPTAPPVAPPVAPPDRRPP